MWRCTGFENHTKSLINKKNYHQFDLGSNNVRRQETFKKDEICWKMPKFKCDLFGNFQTMCDAVWKIHVLLQMQFCVNFFGCSRLIKTKDNLCNFYHYISLHFNTVFWTFSLATWVTFQSSLKTPELSYRHKKREQKHSANFFQIIENLEYQSYSTNT